MLSMRGIGRPRERTRVHAERARGPRAGPRAACALVLSLLLAGCVTTGTGNRVFPPAEPLGAPPPGAARPDPATYVPASRLSLPSTDGLAPHRVASLRLAERGARELAAGQDEAASRTLDRAVALDPGNPYAFYLIGLLRHRQGAFGQSLAVLRKAEILLGADRAWLAETYLLMALDQEALARPREALRLYEAALELEPDQPLARGRAAELRRALP